MTIADIRDICLSFPGITEDIKWEDHLCFNIGGKMFLVTSPDNIPVSASFKTSDEDFTALSNRAGFIPALVDHEPIQVELLLEEASRRLSQKFDSESDFLRIVLELEAQWLDAETKAVLRHAVKIKKIENRNKK